MAEVTGPEEALALPPCGHDFHPYATHEMVDLEGFGNRACIDRPLAGLTWWLWSHGWTTRFSCEEHRKGRAAISFLTAEDFEAAYTALLALVEGRGCLTRRARTNGFDHDDDDEVTHAHRGKSLWQFRVWPRWFVFTDTAAEDEEATYPGVFNYQLMVPRADLDTLNELFAGRDPGIPVCPDADRG